MTEIRSRGKFKISDKDQTEQKKFKHTEQSTK